MEPKAKWFEVFVQTGEWSAEVGPFMLEVHCRGGRCEIWQNNHYQMLWSQTVSTPCDVADIMRLTEAELARRLVKAAETMKGSELAVASSADITETFTQRLLQMRAHDVRPVSCALAPAGWQVAETGEDDAPFELNDQNQLTAEALGASSNSAQHIELEPGHVALVPAPARGKPRMLTEQLRFKVGDQVTARRGTQLRDTMLDAVGTVQQLRDAGTLVVAYGTCSSVTCWPVSLEKVDDEPRFKVGDLVRTKHPPRVGVVAVPRYTNEHSLVDFADLKNETIDNADLEPYALPPITIYADLADALDELPLGTVLEVGSARGTTLFKRDAANRYRCQHPSEDDTAWMYATALTCLREKLVPTPTRTRILPKPGASLGSERTIKRLQETIDNLRADNASMRESLRRMVKHLEHEGQQGDGIAEGAWDDYHAARFLLGHEGTPSAAERGLASIRLALAWAAPGVST